MVIQAAAPLLVVAGMANTQPSAGHRHVEQGATAQRHTAMQVSCAALHTTAAPFQIEMQMQAAVNVSPIKLHQG